MNILITGTDGFVGSHLKEYFTARGHSVYGTVFMRDPEQNEYTIDLTRPETLKAIPDLTFDVVIHTAAIVDQTLPKKLIMNVNAEGTKHVLNHLQGKCRHFIQISSISVYGMKTMGENRCEKTGRCRGPFAIPYMRAKAKAEGYIEESGIPYTILRLPAILGKNDTALSQTIIPRLLDGSFYFCGKKEKKVSIIYVRNLCPIIEAVIQKGPLLDYFNCVCHHMTWRELITEYAGYLKIPVPKKRKSSLVMFTKFHDKMEMLIITFSLFGAHYPNEKLFSRIEVQLPYTWQEGIKEAVEGYLESREN
jgi:nucleoside-diphosphate-sugar epimerase